MKDPHETPENVCPFCGYTLDRAAGVSHNHKPQPGDVTVCINCSEVSVFSATLTLRKPTKVEQQHIDRDSDVLAAQMLIRATKP